MKCSQRFLLLAVAALLSACATRSFPPETAPEYSIIREFTPFYRLGPMQARPDAALRAGTRVKMLRQEMGYSLVQLEDLRTGYVANENMAPAPPRPPEPPAAQTGSQPEPRRSPAGKPKGSGAGARYTGAQPNDIPLPESNVPPPDLNVGPEEVSTPPPGPPPEKPKFRY